MGALMGVLGGNAAPTTLLALDGGNSKTDLLLIDTYSGGVLGSSRGPAFLPHLDGDDLALAALAPAVKQLLAEAGLTSAGLAAGALANADRPAHERALESAIVGRGWADAAIVVNDTLAVLRAGSPSGTGVAVVCGAGINAAAVGPDGREVRFPALGPLTGDWGGGYGLAEQVMWFAARAEDGRGRPTALAEAAASHFGTPDVATLALAVHDGEISHQRLHELVPVLLRVATAGDDAAMWIVRRQAGEIANLVQVCLERLGHPEDSPTPVVLGGGVLSAREPVLMEEVKRRLDALPGRQYPVVLTAPPVLGAALLGLDRLPLPEAGAPQLTLRGAFSPPVPL